MMLLACGCKVGLMLLLVLLAGLLGGVVAVVKARRRDKGPVDGI